MGRGIPLETVTTSTSTSEQERGDADGDARWRSPSSSAESIDDDILVAPTDYQVADVGAQMKRSLRELEQGARRLAERGEG